MTPDPRLVEAVIWQESRGNPRAVNPRTGAMGLMQVMPETAEQPGFGVAPLADPFDPKANRRFGTQYLGAMLRRYEGDTRRALAAYNWGPGNADEWDGSIDSLPAETRDYITRIEGRLGQGGVQVAQADTGTMTDANPSRVEVIQEAVRRGAISREAIVKEALRRGLIDRSVLEAEARRRGLTVGEQQPVAPAAQGAPAPRQPVPQPQPAPVSPAPQQVPVAAQPAPAVQAQPTPISPPQAAPQPAPAQPAPAFEPQTMVGGAIDSLTNGLMLGYGPRLTAIEEAAKTTLGNWWSGGETPGGFGGAYNRALSAETAQQENFSTQHPWADLGFEVGGAIAPAFATGGGTVPAMLRSTPAGLATRFAGGARTSGGAAARGIASGAAAGAVYGSSEGDDLIDRGWNALIGTGTGAAGGVLGEAGVRVLNRIGKGGAKLLHRLLNSGQTSENSVLNARGREVLRRNGIDPDIISDDFAKAFAARVKQAGGETDETARMAQADEFGIPLTRGQATGDEATIALEEASRNNARGAPAKVAVDEIDTRARAAVRQSTDNMTPRIGERAPQQADEAAAVVGADLKAAADQARSAYQAAYDAAEKADGVIDISAFGTLPDALGKAVEGVTLVPSPQTLAALRDVQRLVQNAARGPRGAEGDVVGVGFQALEGLRKRILANQRSTGDGTIKAELGAVVGALDDWTDGVFDAALISGDDAALASIKDARQKYKSYVRAFEGKGPNATDADKKIAQMAQGDRTSQEIANWLYGDQAVGKSGLSVRIAKRLKDILPPESWEAIRAGAWRRVATAREGARDFGPQALSNRVRSFVSGDGSTLAKELFSEQERAQMLRFARAMEILTPPATATNPSRTSYGNARAMADMTRAFANYMGLASGGLAGGLGTVLAQSLGKGAADAARAVRIPAPRPFLATPPSGAGSVGGAVGATETGLQDVRRP